jgi:hypothetical protein
LSFPSVLFPHIGRGRRGTGREVEIKAGKEGGGKTGKNEEQTKEETRRGGGKEGRKEKLRRGGEDQSGFKSYFIPL